jgi:hypothetical protein
MSIETASDEIPELGFGSYLDARGLRPVQVGGPGLDEYTPMMSIGRGGARADGATGPLLGDLPATILHSTYSESRDGAGSRQFTLIVATIGVAIGFARNLSCRDRGVQEDLDRTEIARFGDSREVELESTAFDRRFALQAPPGIDAVWLRELFTPALIDSLSSQAPIGFCFELNEGHFCAAIPGRVVEADTLDAFIQTSDRVAQRIREKALANAGHATRAAHGGGGKRFERLLHRVSFDQPPPDVASAASRYMSIARRRPGNLLRAIGAGVRQPLSLIVAALFVLLVVVVLTGGGAGLGINIAVWLLIAAVPVLFVLWFNLRRQTKALATRLGEEAFVRGYASSRRLRIVDPGGFQVQHARLQLPGAVRHVMVGPLPGTQLEGAIALIDSGVEKDAELSAGAGEAMQSGVMSFFGIGPDDDRTYDAVVVDSSLACVRPSCRRARSAVELDGVCLQAAAVATPSTPLGTGSGP